MQWEMAIEDAADPHGEGFTARVALAKAGTAGLAGQATNALFVAVSAVRADRPVRPQMGFDEGKSGFFLMEVRGGKDRISHWKSPMASTNVCSFCRSHRARRMRSGRHKIDSPLVGTNSEICGIDSLLTWRDKVRCRRGRSPKRKPANGGLFSIAQEISV
jgi:hypothetical protein